MRIVPVILCGGSGSRLQPLSKPETPKQFLKLFSEHSLLQETLFRINTALSQAARDCIYVTLAEFRDKLEEEIAAVSGASNSHILCEPSRKNTSPAIWLAAQYAAKEFGGDVILWVVPSDHRISDHDALEVALNKAALAARAGFLTTFGIEPTKPETGYGYIQKTSEEIGSDVFHVKKFVEKPDLKTAQDYLESGAYLWNSGMFVFTAQDVLKAFEKHTPSMHATLSSSVSLPMAYDALEAQPFDKAVMEHAKNCGVVPCDMGWSDVGSWDSLLELHSQEPDVLRIDVMAALKAHVEKKQAA